MWSFLKGSLLALTMCFNVGPGLMLQFDASLNRGFHAGAAVVGGLYMTNLSILMIGYFGFGRFLKIDQNMTTAGLIGGSALVIFGSIMLIRHVRSPVIKMHLDHTFSARHMIGYFFKGMAMNITNPFNVLFWLSMVGIASSQFIPGTLALRQFFIGLFFTAISVDFLKCYTFSRAGHFLNESALNKINHTMGILVVLFGVILIIRAFSGM